MKTYADYIFDLYGTLVDVKTDEASFAFWKRTAKDACLCCDGETLQTAYLTLCRDEVKRAQEARPDVPVSLVEPELLNVFSRLLASFGGANAPDAQAFARLFRKNSTVFLRPMPHAKETLDALRLRGCRVYLLSNAQACFTVDELVSLDLMRRFDGVLLSSDAGMKKPYRGFFERVLNTYGIDRGAAVMVGNDAAADVGGATDAGLDSIYIHTWSSGARPGPLPPSCREIVDLSELLR